MNSRDKGARLEREAAHALNKEFGVGAQRSARNGVDGASDLLVPGLHVEVKGRARIAALRFADQAEADARKVGRGDWPVVLMRENGGGWYVLVHLENLSGVVERLQRRG